MQIAVGNMLKKYNNIIKRGIFLFMLGRSWARVVVLLDHLKELPPFPMWIRCSIVVVIKEANAIEKDVGHLKIIFMFQVLMNI
jgi:hypothetical protein